jgi:hypothetical protein
MDIVHRALLVSPLLGAAAGYLVGGITGATAGFVIPMRPLVVMGLFGGALTMRYDRYGRRDRPSPQTRRPERVRLQRGGIAMRPPKRAVARGDRESR